MQQQIQRLETVSVSIADQTRAITALREQLSIIEADHVLDVQGATNEQGKPQYPNEDARKAALTLRLADDEHYRQLSLKLCDAEQERARLAAAQERLRQEFKLYVLDRQEEVNRAGDGLPAGFPFK